MSDKPKRTIRSIITDIRNPQKAKKSFETVNLARVPKGGEFRFSAIFGFLRRLGIVLLILLVLGGVFFFFSLQDTKKTAGETVGVIAENFAKSVSALREFHSEKAIVPLRENERKLEELKSAAASRHTESLLRFAGLFVPSLGSGLSLFSDVHSLNEKFLALAEEIGTMRANGIRYATSDGQALIASLLRARDLAGELNANVQGVRNNASVLREAGIFTRSGFLENDYLGYSTELIRAEKFLSAFAAMLGDSGEKHVLVVFQNTGEMRPGGGVAQIYADVVFQHGQIAKITAGDMREIDAGSIRKIIPPTELRTEMRAWGARDANWFFDFPTSAETYLSFFENAKPYIDSNTKFEGVIAVNDRAMSALLGKTGPIKLDELNLSVSSDTFRGILERKSYGMDGRVSDPKKIMNVFLPVFLSRMSALPGEQADELSDLIFEAFSSRDIMAYAKNQDMRSFLSSVGADGGSYVIPNGFFGVYLAIVNANIGGGTDAYTDQKIDARIDLDTNTGVFTDLTIERMNRADTAGKGSWRTGSSRNFSFIYASPLSSLVSMKGNDVRGSGSKFDYRSAEYIALPQLEKIENTRVFSTTYQAWTMDVSGKVAYGAWFNANPGETKTLEVRSQVPVTPNSVIEPGKAFTFVFERQAGVPTALKLSVSAPLGYVFKETGGPLYLFEDQTNVGRIVIPLTLAK